MAQRLDGLDGLRGVAALAVVGFHYRGINAPGSVWSAGWLSVDLFFLLSGYVIARAYEHRLRSGLSVSSFVGIRYRRLWFAYAVGCSFGLAYLLLHQINSAVLAYLVQLTFWPSFIVPGQFFPANTPGWTLYCELFVNVLYAAFVARLSNRSVSVLTALVCAAFAVIAVERGDWMESPDFGAGFLRALAPYLIGVCLFRSQVKPWSAG